MDEWAHRVQIAIHQLKQNLASERLKRSEHEITRPQMFVLYTIHKCGKSKLTQLADKIEVKPSAITVMIDRLEKSGYVKRTPDKTDRRAITVEVTSLGEEVLEKSIQETNDILKVYLQRLTPEEVQIFTELLEKVAEPEQASDKCISI